MMTLSSQAKDMPFVTVHDGVGPLRFPGEVVADLSWTYEQARESGHTRWTNIRLYRVLGKNPYKYVIEVVGRSVIYHVAKGPCRKGVAMTVKRVSEDTERYDALIPCPIKGCQPVDLDDLNDDDMVAVEVDFPSITKCRSADQVVAELRRDGSNLSLKLLQAACLGDRAIEEAAAGMRYL